MQTLVTRGLTSEEVAASLREHGPNLLPATRRPHPVRQLLRQMTHLLAMLLWIAAGMAALGGLTALAVAICVIVVLNGVFAFLQEHHADRVDYC